MTHAYISTKIITAWPESRPNGDGYAVTYPEGYTIWSPKATFEEAYRVVEGEDQRLSFGDALVFLKAGRRVSRGTWPAGVFVYHVAPDAYVARSEVAKKHFGDGALVPYKAYLAIKQADNEVWVFVPGMDSLLAEDWRVVE